MSKEERIDFLEDERKKIWGKIIILEELLNKKTSDYESEAKESSEQASLFKNISEEAKNIITQNLEEANSKLQEIKAVYNSFEEVNTIVKVYSVTSKENSELIKTIYDNIQSKSIIIQNQIADLEKIFENKPILDDKLIKLESIFVRGDDYDSKISVLHKSIIERKKDFDEIYYKIFGYSATNEAGVSEEVKGLKDELEVSYAQIKFKLDDLDKELINLKAITFSAYKKSAEEKDNLFANKLEMWEEKYSKIENTITELLPRALTTGLSYAYSDKREAEVTESKNLSKTFYIAIVGLIVVSLIPFLISIQSILDKTSIEEVILRIPRLVLAILPLYIPVLWVAHSSNRKMNLSKRLIEEYSHKEVLSKTFEGLSKQINNIDDKDISSDLRIKLLYNILEVNSENPGKLISDYNKSDHPLMDALDKSIKLTNAITKLSKIPGFSKLVSTLEKKSQEMLKKEAQKAEAGLNSIEEK